MSYPNITLKQCDYAQITQNKTGDLAMVYKPLLNLVLDTTLGDFTTDKLNFNRYDAQDMIIVDEFDGSTNIIINDDHNQPRLINSGFSVQEDNTFLIPEHYTNTVTNIYDSETFKEDTLLLKLYANIPKLDFLGFGDGSFKCGSYVFYFRLADSVGNMSNVVQHSSTVLVFIGENNSYKVRMGLEDENANKSIKFKLTNVDSGFDYLRVFYERTSSGADLAGTTLFYMVDLNFPIVNGICNITLTGEEQVLGISLLDLKNEYADIASCKTQTIVDNTLFLANTKAFEHDYAALQRMAWCIYPQFEESSEVPLPDTDVEFASSVKGYYDPKNIYSKVGYWPDEYYRFGIVFIYNNNLLSPVFNIMGYDLNKVSDENLTAELLYLKGNGNAGTELPEFEPDNYFFKKHILSNSKGVVKLKKCKNLDSLVRIKFDLATLGLYIVHTQDLTQSEKDLYINSDGAVNWHKFLGERHGIKGFFFVRLKRIPTVIALGLVVGLTKKEYGSIPILEDGNLWKTKSFLNKDRLILDKGATISTFNEDNIERVVTQALLVPDAELQEATFNQLFTSQEFALQSDVNCKFNIKDDENWWEYSSTTHTENADFQLVKLTAVPKDTTVKTNGVDFFSTIAGSAEEAYKTEDIYNIWEKTKPQDLTVSNTLIRGRWGYYVGMSANSFKFGDVVSIKKAGFIKNPEQNLLEFLDRFSDNTFYSPISTRYSIDSLPKNTLFIEYGGDCFTSMFTHRMMTNFIDPELPTNNKIVNPGCWCENYAVRCTALILADTSSNLVGESAGFYINVKDNKSSIVSLIFGILTGNLGTIITSINKLVKDPVDPEQEEYANEVAQAFELYVGDTTKEDYAPPYIIGVGADQTAADDYKTNALQKAASEGKIKKVNPKEQEQNASGFNLKALFKSDDNWELHGISQINRADINAVALGQWITFPVRSSMNLALRDVDYSQATEEAKFSKKRSFYPLEARDIKNKLPDSNVINGAAKKTIHKNSYPVYKTVPFMKLEYFNRIYWSKPNVSDAFLNSYRLIYTDLYKEYNKEFGDITKILPLGNSLFVCFDHGMGVLPVDRSVKTESEASPYLASRNVLPAQVTTLSKDFGSMWKNSIIQTPNNVIYGVDTVGKKIWRTNGQNVEFISDHYVTKFLNEFIDLSEFDYRAYLGHLDVKTHYNNFKHDVIFTLVKDKPKYLPPTNVTLDTLRSYIRNVWGTGNLDDISVTRADLDDKNNGTFKVLFGHVSALQLPKEYESYEEIKQESGVVQGVLKYGGRTYIIPAGLLTEKTAEIQNGKIYVNDLFTGIWCDIESWESGTVWSLCYNEVLQKWITFYDWYPVESCNVDNIFFSFDLELIDNVYDNIIPEIQYINFDNVKCSRSNKFFIDKSFATPVKIYRIDSLLVIHIDKNIFNLNKTKYISCYWKNDAHTPPSLNGDAVRLKLRIIKEDGWEFIVWEVPAFNAVTLTVNNAGETDICELKIFYLPNNETWEDLKDGTPGYQTKLENESNTHLKYYEIRDYYPNRMLLWKHGQAGLYDNQGKIKPTHWYDKPHEFNFEFVVNENPVKQKIFNNLKLLSNKAAPAKFEYEVVGEGYEWFEYKPIVEWVNKKAEEEYSKYPDLYQDVDHWRDTIFSWLLNQTSRQISSAYPDFPKLFDLDRVIRKLPYLKMRHTDKKGTPERPHYKWDNGTDYWGGKPYDKTNRLYTYNCSEPCLVEDDLLNEVRLRTESLGNDMKKYGRIRGNMQYLEDLWNVEIRPVQITWCYLDDKGKFQTKKVTETKHRDKYLKVKVRYSGEDLALILAIYTIFDESYA